jgi:hypothetical protein
MYRQIDDFAIHGGSRIKCGSGLRKRVLAGLAALLLPAILVAALGAAAHDMDLEQARQKVEPYVRSVTQQGYETCEGGICVRTASSDGAGKTVKRLWISGNPRPGKPLDFYQIRNIPGDIREQVKGKGGPYAYHGSGTVSIQGCYRGTFKTFCSRWVEFKIY